MKKIFFIFSLLILAFLFPISDSFAYDPIIITKSVAIHPRDNKDQNYIPVDPNKVPVDIFGRFVQISQSFPPIQECEGTGLDRRCWNIWQTITEINQKVGDFRNWTNYGPRYFNIHFGSTPKKPLDEESVKIAFTTYNTETPSGASNAARRFLSNKTLECLIGKRMWDAAETLFIGKMNNPNNTNVDTIIDKSHGIRISDVAAAYASRNKKIFYDPDGPACNPDVKPQLLPFSISTKFSINEKNVDGRLRLIGQGIDFTSLYENAIQPINDNSLAGAVRECDMEEGNILWDTCKDWENRSFPQSGAYPGNGAEVMTWIMPKGSSITSTNFGEYTTDEPTKDKTNGFFFDSKHIHHTYWDGVLDFTQTFADPVYIQYKVPINLENGIRTSEAAMRWLIPKKVYAEKNFDSLTGSSTDGRLTLDPGYKDSKIRHEVKCQLLPVDWQGSDCKNSSSSPPTPTQPPQPPDIDGDANCNAGAPEASGMSTNKLDFIDMAKRWIEGHDTGDKNARKCFNDVVCRAKNAGINPDFALWVWLHESGASHYEAFDHEIEDFGIHNGTTPTNDFDAQITRFLTLDPAAACPNISDYWLAFSTNYLTGGCDPNVKNPITGWDGYDYKEVLTDSFQTITNSSLPSSIHIDKESCP